MTVEGQGGTGVDVAGGVITSSGGDVSVTGIGGVRLISERHDFLGGIGSVMVEGQGATGGGIGVNVSGAGAVITSTEGMCH